MHEIIKSHCLIKYPKKTKFSKCSCDNSLVATSPGTLGFEQPLNGAWSAWVRRDTHQK